MTEHEDLIAEANENLDKAADAAPASARQAILTGKVEDQRMSLIARLKHAFEKVAAERDNWRLSAEEAERAEQRAKKRAKEAERSYLSLEWERIAKAEMKRRKEAEAERDALAAVVREALDVARSGSVPLGVQEARHFDRLLAETRRVLQGSPSVALDRVKAEAAVQALREAADEADTLYFGGGSTGSANRWGAKAVAKRLRDRADRIEKGESNG